MEHVLSHYDVLGVEPTADLDAIRRAWRVKVRLLHPDKHQGSPDDVQAEAAKETLQVNRAWETLRDPEKRHRYDLQLAHVGEPEAPKRARNERRPPPRRPHDESTSEVVVVCTFCQTTQRVPRMAGRFECSNCRMAWQFAKCDWCNNISHVRERRTSWRCESCGREQHSSWGGGNRSVVCVRCKSGNAVAGGVPRFNCSRCRLEHLRCSCGEYTTYLGLPWPRWRCPKCKRVNRLAPRYSSDVAQFVVLFVAVCFVVAGLILLAGLMQ